MRITVTRRKESADPEPLQKGGPWQAPGAVKLKNLQRQDPLSFRQHSLAVRLLYYPATPVK